MTQQLAPVPRYEAIRRSTTGLVKTGSGVLHGYYVNVTTSAAVTLAEGGPGGNLIVIPTAAVVGIFTLLDMGFATSLTATFAGTGDITFLYR